MSQSEQAEFYADEGTNNQQFCLINRWLVRSEQQVLTRLLPGQEGSCEHCARASLPYPGWLS